MYRRPKTTQEKRQNPRRGFVEEDGYKVKVRAKRCKSNLVDSWDDIRPCIQNSWKVKRKTQYYGVEK